MPRLISSLVATLAVYMAVEIVDLTNQLGGSALIRYPLRIPLALVFVTPIALLISGCWTSAHLLRTGQLTALAAAGRGPQRGLFLLPCISILIAGVSWLIAVEVAPRGLASSAPASVGERWPTWARSEGGTLIRLGGKTKTGYQEVLIVERDDLGFPQREISAAEVFENDGAWQLRDVVTREGGAQPKRSEFMISPVSIPETIGVGVPPQHLTNVELRRSARSRALAGSDAAPYEAERGLRVALALACIPCMAFGVVIGVRFGRKTGAAAVAIALIGLFLWAILSPIWALTAVGFFSWTAVAFGPTVLGTMCSLVAWWGWLRVR